MANNNHNIQPIKALQQNVLFDTSRGTLNMGDYIICDSIERELHDILRDGFLVRIASHTPVTHFYQNIERNSLYKYCKEANFKFFAGTDILQYHLFMRPWANFNVNLFNYAPYKNMILVAAGSNKNRPKMDLYTKLLYKKVLNKKYIHSVRDESTKKLLESMGLKAINTGCATMWRLNKNHCAEIPKYKAKTVIFTLTDYCKDIEKDKKLIDILKNNYKKVYFWVQGSGDYEYIQKITDINSINIIGPNLDDYKEILTSGDIDYVGTRLHAGIYALQHKVRSIILAVDNRALDIKETYNIIVLERKKIDELERLINSEFSTNIKIDEKKIAEWKAQFKQNVKK